MSVDREDEEDTERRGKASLFQLLNTMVNVGSSSSRGSLSSERTEFLGSSTSVDHET